MHEGLRRRTPVDVILDAIQPGSHDIQAHGLDNLHRYCFKKCTNCCNRDGGADTQVCIRAPSWQMAPASPHKCVALG